jgi:hypothetical protein
MVQCGFRFEFDRPDDWSVGREENRFTHHSPPNELLIVSGAILKGPKRR